MSKVATAKGLKWALGVPRVPQPVATHRPSRRLIFVNRFFHPDLSATGQLLTDLVRGLCADQYDVHVVCSRQLYDNAHAALPVSEQAVGATVHRCWSTRHGRDQLLGRAFDYASFVVSAAARLVALVRPGDIVVVLTDPPMMSVPAALITSLRGARLVNWLQDVFPEVAIALGVLPLPRWGTQLLLGLRNWTLRLAARNVVLGPSMRRFIKAKGVPEDTVAVIENWADADALTPRPPQWSILRRGLRAECRFVIQYSGNMGRAHEYETLLGAALELREEKEWLFLFVGGGTNMQALRQKAEQLGLQNMSFLPLQPREALADSLAAADVHVTCLLPALEGLIVPSKLYGMLAAGRPVLVIGDQDGEQACLVRGAHCGSVITRGDSPGLVDELRRIRSDPEWMHEAGLNARHLFERRYTLLAATRKWHEVLAGIG